MKNSSKTAMLVAMAFASPIVNAQAYIGVSVGQSYFSNFKIDVDSPVMVRSEGLNVSDDNSASIKISTGYDFNQYLAIEGSIGGYDALDGSIGSLGDMRFFAFQGKATLPITKKFNTFIKAGFSYYSSKFESIYGNVTDSSVAGKYGLGLEYKLTDQFSAIFEWDYMKAEMDILKLPDTTVTMATEINVFSLGAAYRF